MPAKNYSNRKKTKDNDSGNGILGLILVIVSIFFLICIFFSTLLSSIGALIRNVVMGLMGVTCIPFFFCTLILGIAMMQNRKPALSFKNLLCILATALSLVFILQLATTSGLIGQGIGEYISVVFDAKWSVGGILYGIIVYGIAAALTPVVTYILFSLVMVISLATLFFNLFQPSRSRKAKKALKAGEERERKFVKGAAGAKLVQPVVNNGLFVDSIVPNERKITSSSGSFEEIQDDPKQQISRFGNNREFEAYKRAQQEEANTQYKTEAHRILFGDRNNDQNTPNASYKKEYKTGYKQGDNSYDAQMNFYNQYMSNYIPSGLTAAPKVQEIQSETKEVPKKPDYGLREIVIPKSKDFSHQIVGGTILNGDTLSEEIRELKSKNHDTDIDLAGQDRHHVVAQPYTNTAGALESGGIINGDLFHPASQSGSLPGQAEIQSFGYQGKAIDPRTASQTYAEQQRPESPPYQASYSGSAIKESDIPSHSYKNNWEQTADTFFGAQETDDESPASYFGQADVNDPDETMDSDQFPSREQNFETLIKADRAIMQAMQADDLGEEDTATQADSFINGDYFQERSAVEPDAEESAFLQESPEDDEDDADTGLYVDTAESKNQEAPSITGNVSGFRVMDEVLDKSEKYESQSKDDTGYYQKMRPIVNAINVAAAKNHFMSGSNVRKEAEEEAFEKKTEHIEQRLFSQPPQQTIKPENQIRIDEYLTETTITEKPVAKKRRHAYTPPPIDLLLNNSTDPNLYGGDCEKNAVILEETLKSLKFPAKVIGITKGPAVTRYELETPPGIPVKRVENCAKDIAYALASEGKIRIETPIPGRRAVGIEVPNEEIAIVCLRDIIDSKEFASSTSNLTLALGKDITGQIITCNLEKMPHLLIAGSTGSGKSACLNSIITSILYKASPEDVRLILIDPKQVEFVVYRDMPHLLIKSIITEPTQAINAFKWAKMEMEKRYKLFSKYAMRNIQDFNNSKYVREGQEQKLPYIVIIVDELSDLMMSSNRKDLEDKIMSMAQKARAAGLHLILATQRPSVDVITGTIKANLPSRIAFSVASIPDSRTILDQSGAEALLGRGDMLYSPLDSNDPKRVQGAFITSEEVTGIVEYVKQHNNFDFDDTAEHEIMYKEEEKKEEEPAAEESIFDPLMPDAVRRVIETGQASTSMIQRRFSVGYARAARIMDQMEMHKFVGPSEGSRPREVYITREQYREIFGDEI